MRKFAFIALGLLVPAMALAASLADVEDRAAASGDYYVGSDLSTQFGRMSASGDYLPGGFESGGGGSGTGYEQNILLLGVGQ